MAYINQNELQDFLNFKKMMTQSSVTPQQKQPSFLKKMALGITSPFRRMGEDILSIGRFAANPNKPIESYKPTLLSQNEFQERMSGNPLFEALKTGAGIGAWAVPGGATFGGGLKGAVASGALAGGMGGFSVAEKPEDILKSVGTGALMGGGTGAAVYGAGKLLKNLGKAKKVPQVAEEGGEETLSRKLKTSVFETPESTSHKFKDKAINKEIAEDLVDTLEDNTKWQDLGFEKAPKVKGFPQGEADLYKLRDAAYTNRNNLLSNSDISVNESDLIQGAKTDPKISSFSLKDKAVNDVMNDMKSGGIPILEKTPTGEQVLNLQEKIYNANDLQGFVNKMSKIKYNKLGDPLYNQKANVAKSFRDYFQSYLRGLEDPVTGLTYSRINEIVQPIENAINSGHLSRLATLYRGYSTIPLVPGSPKLPKVWGTMAKSKAANLLEKAPNLQNLGRSQNMQNLLQNPALNTLGRVATKAAPIIGGVSLAGLGRGQQGEVLGTSDMGNLDLLGATQGIGASQSPNQSQQYAIQLLNSGMKPSDVKIVMGLLGIGGDGGGGAKMTDQGKKFAIAEQQAQGALNLLEKGVPTGKLTELGGKISRFFGKESPERTQYRSQLALARTALRNAMLGANMTEREIESISGFIPEYTDEPEIARNKLTSFIRAMKQYSQLGGMAEGTLGETTPEVDTSQLGYNPYATTESNNIKFF